MHVCISGYLHVFIYLLCLSKGYENASLAVLWLHQVGRPPNVISV